MTSVAVAVPGNSGMSDWSAASSTEWPAPGETMNLEPALTAWSHCLASSTVPAPATAPSTSSATDLMASSAAGVRMVISIALRPPLTRARASGTADLASSMMITGTTG